MIVPMPSSIRILLLVLASIALPACSRKEAGPSEAPPPQVTVQRPIIKEIVEWDEYTGRLEAVDYVEVRARVSGFLESVHFEEGQPVKKGAVLFKIDPRPFKAEVAARAAAVEEAKARLQLAEMNRNRAKGLVESKAIAQEEFDTRVNAYAQALAAVDAAKAELEAANLQLEFTEVTAPISGIIGKKRVTEGNLVTGGAEGTTVLTTIVPHNPIYAYFNIDEHAVLKYLRLVMEGKMPGRTDDGQATVEMGLADSEGYPFKGTIDFVNNRLDEETATLEARAKFENDDEFLTPGLFARLRMPGSPKYSATLIPDEAVGSDQRSKYVWVITDKGIAEKRPVTLGPLHEDLRIVRSGLEPTDRIVVNGLQRVRPGAPVEATEIAPDHNEGEASNESAAK